MNEAQCARTMQIIDTHGRDPAALIAILQDVQAENSYLSQENLELIAKELNVAISKVYGVATFFENFSLEAKGKHLVKVCNGTACHVRKSLPIYDAVREHLGLTGKRKTTDDGIFTLETVACLGACGLAPVMTIDGEVHAKMNPDKALPCWMRSGQRRWPRNEDRNKSGADRKTRPGAGMAGRGGSRDPRVRGHGLHRGRIDEGL